MLWLLRAGILLEFVGALLLSAALGYLWGEQRMENIYTRVRDVLHRFLQWLLNTSLYRQMRLRKVGPESSIWTLIRENWLTLGIMIVVAYIGLSVLLIAIGTLNAVAIVFAIPFAVLSGLAFARHYSNRLARGLVFCLFTIASPMIYGLLIWSVLFHAALLVIISYMALVHSFLAKRTVQRAMIVLGLSSIVIGAAVQFAYTFI